MRRILLLSLLAVAFAGCHGETARPTATGKGTVRMINGLDSAPDVSFYVEERFLETVARRQGSGFVQWDDFTYVFNFETNVIGERESRRFASRELEIAVDREYTMLVTGSIDDPTVTVWETPEREFDGTESVFEARFANLSPTAGSVDVYLTAPATAPVLGEQIGTLAPGEFLDPVDVEEGDYVLTFTAAGDPANVLFEAATGTYVASNVSTFVLFDGSELDTGAHVVELIGNSGGGNTIRDVRAGQTVRFIQGSISLADADIYDDEDLTSLVIADHRFGDATGDIPVASGQNTFIYTAAGNSSVELFTIGITPQPGLRYNVVAVNEGDVRVGQFFLVNRRSVATQGRLHIFQSSANHPQVDIYVVERDAGFTGEGRVANGLNVALQTLILFDDRSIDVYVTPEDDDTVLGGPYPVDFQLGDTVEMFILDAVDPSVVDIRVYPAP